jgi:predicted O-linked N-acetylglucosamine transferase (SPINDLY family)
MEIALAKEVPMTNAAESLARGWSYHQAGDLHGAEQIYREVLAADPHHVDAWYLCGVACQMRGDLAEAIACYEQALRVRPDHAESHNNLGVALAVQKRYAEAVPHYQQALSRKPEYADSYSNLGIALTELGRLDEAIASLRQALVLQPSHGQAHYNLGNAFQKRGQLDEAVANYCRALTLNPNQAEARNNLGAALTRLRRLDEAVTQLGYTVTARPDYTEARTNLGNALRDLGRLDEAETCYRQVLQQLPDDAGALTNLGNTLKELGRLDEAVACYRQVMEHDPDDSVAYSNLLVCLGYDPGVSPAALYEEHQRWGQRHGRPEGRFGLAPEHDRNPERVLRIGYMSPDLYHHAVASFLEPVLAHHDPTRVEIYCYAEVFAPDAVTTRLRSHARGWTFTCGLSDAELADRVRADGIDILVDLAGHTANSRLRVFGLRPAPVQVSYLGYPATTGLETIDYRLTDAVADPPGEPSCHTEDLWRLPGGFCCWAPPANAPNVSEPPSQPSGYLTFGALHNLAKLNGAVLDLWCAVLRAVPTSRLKLFRHTLQGGAAVRLQEDFDRRGLGGRVDLQHLVGGGEGHLAFYEDIDVSLDAFPWSGHTTGCESLWMGVPVLTLCGNRYAGRMVASVLTRLGLAEWVARTPEEYVATAARVAADLDALVPLRAGLRERVRHSPLCDGPAFTRELEDAYRAMWRRWCLPGNASAKDRPV